MKQLCVSLLKYASTASCSSCFAPPWSLMYPHQTKVTRIILQILILLFIIRLCIRISSIYPQEYTVRRLLTFHHTSSNDVLAFDLFYRHRTLIHSPRTTRCNQIAMNLADQTPVDSIVLWRSSNRCNHNSHLNTSYRESIPKSSIGDPHIQNSRVSQSTLKLPSPCYSHYGHLQLPKMPLALSQPANQSIELPDG